eukprot:13839563-Heterocapsa_arctica.AAC.1
MAFKQQHVFNGFRAVFGHPRCHHLSGSAEPQAPRRGLQWQCRTSSSSRGAPAAVPNLKLLSGGLQR